MMICSIELKKTEPNSKKMIINIKKLKISGNLGEGDT